MIHSDVAAALRGKGLNTLRALWGAILGSMALLGVVLWQLSPQGTPESVALAMPMYAVAAVMAAASVTLRRVLPLKLAGTGTLDRHPVLGVTATNHAERRALKLFVALQSASVLGFALAESVALIGFTLTFLTGDMVHFLSLGTAGVVLMVVVHLPNRGAIEELLRSAETSTPQ